MGPCNAWHGKAKVKVKAKVKGWYLVIIIGSRAGDIIDGGFTHVLRRVGDRAVFLLPLPSSVF